MNDLDLYIDLARWQEKKNCEIGIPIRAKQKSGGDYVTVDIGLLEKDSLLAWLRSSVAQPRDFSSKNPSLVPKEQGNPSETDWAVGRATRSRGGDNPLAENVVGILLGHGRLHE